MQNQKPEHLLTVLKNLLRRDKTEASQQSGLQRVRATPQNLASQAQAVLNSLTGIRMNPTLWHCASSIFLKLQTNSASYTSKSFGHNGILESRHGKALLH